MGRFFNCHFRREGKDIGIYYVQYFDAALANWFGEKPGVCIFAKHCGHAGVMEFNGDVFSCDHLGLSRV